MKPDYDRIVAPWTRESDRQGYKRRNWPAVRRWAALCVTLMAGAVAAREALDARTLFHAFFAGAIAAGAVMLRHYLDPRLFVERPPTQ
ncbi:hypothetical protein [Sphingomonas lenta]|uniref:Uncharacterized protein n=1 Tax=Sphingomonas lenta TaxID=1141887 RepID=A0A2A2SBJ2_9SPHN|nr:hypothetical protein [Sphingomonas lenta]PAX06391.1 hypothetical protein CKY28_17470 [Sphingomonas lenta]